MSRFTEPDERIQKREPERLDVQSVLVSRSSLENIYSFLKEECSPEQANACMDVLEMLGISIT